MLSTEKFTYIAILRQVFIRVYRMEIQGGSDKSGILQAFLKNYTAQLKINRFYRNKNKLAEEHIENQLFQ